MCYVKSLQFYLQGTIFYNQKNSVIVASILNKIQQLHLKHSPNDEDSVYDALGFYVCTTMTITVWKKLIRIIFKGAVRRKIFYLILILFRLSIWGRIVFLLNQYLIIFQTYSGFCNMRCQWDALWCHLLHTDQINFPKWGIYPAITAHWNVQFILA